MLHTFVSCRAEMADACFSTQLIDGDGVFNVSGLENFMKEVRLGECGLSYAVVSIMGPQSSGMGFSSFHCLDSVYWEFTYVWSHCLPHFCFAGKSTLLNHLFRTNFREMDAFRGRYATICQYKRSYLCCSLLLRNLTSIFFICSGRRLPKVYGWQKHKTLNHAPL